MSLFKKNNFKLLYFTGRLILLKIVISVTNFFICREKPNLKKYNAILINDVLGLYQTTNGTPNKYEDFNLCKIYDTVNLKFIRVYLPVRGLTHTLHYYKKMMLSSSHSFIVFELISLSDIIKNVFCTEKNNDLDILPNLMVQSIINEYFKVVLVVCEYCNTRKKIVFLSKQLHIPTIALQHGISNSSSWIKLYSNPENTKFIPNITCVFGDADKNFLLAHGIYTPDQLVVTGSPRYDIIYHADEIYSREIFCANNNIPQNHRIILWTTQSHGMTDEENIRQLNLVFGACDAIPDITLVIKQHPGEKKKHYRLINSYCRRCRLSSVILPKDSDTFEALYSSDLVITFHSTTGREAVAFKKPVVVLDPHDRGGYIGEGVGMGIFSIPQAVDTITSLLKDDNILAANREKYIERNFYAIDGKSTERVVRVIESIMCNK